MSLSRRRLLLGFGTLGLTGAAVVAIRPSHADSLKLAYHETLGQGGGRPAQRSSAPPVVDTAKLHSPGTLEDMILGADDAPVTIVEYASVTCGACAAFHQQTYMALKEKYIDTGKVRLILREFPTQPAQVSIAGFMLARCSGDRYFPVIDTLFEQFSVWGSDPYNGFLRIARQAGMTQEQFETCLKDQQLAAGIQEIAERGNREFQVEATPTFFINGHRYVGVLSMEQLEKIIEPLL